MVFFEQSIPAGSDFNFTVNAKDGTSTYYLDAKVTQANFVPGQYDGGSVTGEVVNQNAVAMNGPIATPAYCFAADGTLAYVFPGFVSGNGDLAPGATGGFTASLFMDVDCSSYLVGASGYGQV